MICAENGDNSVPFIDLPPIPAYTLLQRLFLWWFFLVLPGLPIMNSVFVTHHVQLKSVITVIDGHMEYSEEDVSRDMVVFA